MYGWANKIVRTAVESVPEEILENESVKSALEYLGSWIDQYSDYIEPHGDHYNDLVYEAERDGAYEVRSKVVDILKDAQYRQNLFGTQIDLGAIIKEVSDDGGA